jgi:hypothetical protein
VVCWFVGYLKVQNDVLVDVERAEYTSFSLTAVVTSPSHGVLFSQIATPCTSSHDGSTIVSAIQNSWYYSTVRKEVMRKKLRET